MLFDGLAVLILEIVLELLLLHLKLALELLLVELKLVLEEDDFRLQLDDDLLLLDHHGGDLALEMIDQILLALQLALALLVVDPQVLVLYLDFIEELLDLAEVLRVVFLGEGFSHLLELLLQPLIAVLEVPDLRVLDSASRAAGVGVWRGRATVPR